MIGSLRLAPLQLVPALMIAAAGCTPVWRSPITVRVPVETQTAFAGRLPAYIIGRALDAVMDEDLPRTVRMGALCAPAAIEAQTGFVYEVKDCASEVEVVAWLLPVPEEDRAALACELEPDPEPYETGAVPADVPQGRTRAFRGLGPCSDEDGTPEEIVLRPPPPPGAAAAP
jgi:hypothetical protein